MGRLIETVGKYADHPYYIAQTDTAVYCVEELCFVLSRYSFLLDRGLLDQALIKWLDTECRLPGLARELTKLFHQKGSLSAMAGIILEYVSYGTKKERQEAEEMLRQSADMDASSKQKAFADYLVESGRFSQALAEYDRILEEVPAANHVMRSELLFNKGVALCRLFAFEEAAEVFSEAYEEDPGNDEAGVCYLAALRMRLSEEDYIAFVAENKVWHEQSLQVEERMEKCRREYEASDGCRTLTRLLSRKDTGFYEEISGRMTDMKGKYREMVVQP